jgi:hypothetical protein
MTNNSISGIDIIYCKRPVKVSASIARQTPAVKIGGGFRLASIRSPDFHTDSLFKSNSHLNARSNRKLNLDDDLARRERLRLKT